MKISTKLERLTKKYGDKAVTEAGIIHDYIWESAGEHPDSTDITYWKRNHVFEMALEMLKETVEERNADKKSRGFNRKNLGCNNPL